MFPKRAVLAIMLAYATAPFAQVPPRPAVPDTPAALQCDRFAGAAREQCQAMEKQRQQARGPGDTCDGMAGQAREACLRDGGTIEAGAKASAGAGAPPQPK
jgi:hypothetical protein